MATYLVRTPLKLKGERIAAGELVELDDKTAAPLKRVKAIAAVPQRVTPAEPGQAEATQDGLPADFPGREALLTAGIDSLQAVRNAGEEDLAAVKGIGPATLKAILAALAA